MKSLRWIVPLALGATALGVPAAHAAPRKECPRLDSGLSWYGDNRAKLQQFLCAGHRGRVALFDWDNTVVKNDVGDATTYWLLRNDKVLQPARQDWRTTSRFLTGEAAAALKAACGTSVRPGRPLPTSTDTACADEILSVYGSAKTTGGAAAFAGWNHRRTEPSYAWAAQLLAGHTPGEVRRFAAAARAENLKAPVDAVQTVGSHQVTGWVRYYDQQRDLIRKLRRAGLDVWIVSASAQPVVQVWARGAGVRPDHVIGIENTRRAGRLTARLTGCGGDPDAITYIDGKRCAVNRRVLGVPERRAYEQAPAWRRQAFAAGDSDTDVTFVSDATDLRLVLNRNKAELMCRGYFNADGKWLVNPMFLQPKGRKSTRYPCSTTAYTAPDGTPGPVRENGRIVPDQADTVFSP
ncbi:haloacid dehalogenase-like hydrolase [Actinomadura macrotermitis]|uniref:phosphoserine phosphatase n=1 Tax=Actinomadura macrotermitis TaxID=2585200 RepID=A0A7K0C0T8_9ACTN|nr:haloacid dehalogenase-like hydrolase [Actinomadura macrotermitis]MQY07085.1 hypothetical protein [Actinomadura macrotermitis]